VIRLLATPDAIAEARRCVDGVDVLLTKHRADDVRLMISELVTNSIRHGDLAPTDTIELSFEASEGDLRVLVRDPGVGFSPVPTERDGGHRWGLFLVGRLSDRWGVSLGPSDTVVWFEVGIS